MPITTPLTSRLGITHPILSAPMDVIAGARLTAAVSAAGGFGILGGALAGAAIAGAANPYYGYSSPYAYPYQYAYPYSYSYASPYGYAAPYYGGGYGQYSPYSSGY